MTKGQIFKTAHKLAKTFEGDYRARLAMALKYVYAEAKRLQKVVEIEKELNKKYNRTARSLTEKILAGIEYPLCYETMYCHLNPENSSQIIMVGNTYNHKEEIKSVGGKWNPIERYWTVTLDQAIELVK